MSTTADPEVTTEEVLNAGVTFDRSVPRHLVHKLAVEEVLLTDFKQIGDDDFVIAGQLPRSHTYLSDVLSPYYDFLVFGELVRQSALLVSHAFLDVIDDAHYIFRKIGNQIDQLALDNLELLRVKDHPAEAIVHFNVGNRRVRKGRTTSYDIMTRAFIDGAEVGSGHGQCSLMAMSSYLALREQMKEEVGVTDDTPPAVEPLDPARVGRRDVRNVVLGEFAPEGDSFAAGLVIRLDHPFFFDHPQDHVPGHLLLESVRQMALCSAEAGADLPVDRAHLAQLNVEFLGFTELGAPARAVAEVGEREQVADGVDRVPVVVSIMQGDTLCARGDIAIVGRV